MPSRVLTDYFALVDQLREQRRAVDWQAENDREILARLEDLYELLSDDERDQVEMQGERAWPDLFDLLAKSGDTSSDEEDDQ
jgi:hypothetical protein